MDGSYDIYPSDDGSSDITYHLVVDLKVPLPVFVKRRAEGRITYTALKELRARVETSDPPELHDIADPGDPRASPVPGT